MEKNKSRGFFFTVMALVMLSFMLLTVQIWVKTFEQSDKRASERFKGEAIRIVLATLSDRALSDFANASAYYAAYKMVEHTSHAGNALQLQGSSADEIVNRTAYGLMLNGTSGLLDSGGNRIIYSQDENQSYTMRAWHEKISQAASVMGFRVLFSEMRNFSYRQADPWTVEMSFDMDMNVTDMGNTMRQSKKLHANVSFPINGFIDPLVSRREAYHGTSGRVEKNIWKNPLYNVSSDVAPRQIGAKGSDGAGWFFGPLTNSLPFNFPSDNLERASQYIYYTSDPDQVNVSTISSFYGGLLIIGKRSTTSRDNVAISGCVYNITDDTHCVNCVRRYATTNPSCAKSPEIFNNISTPYIVVDSQGDFDAMLASLPLAHNGNYDDRFLLFDNEIDTPEYDPRDIASIDSYHRLWNVNSLRDMAICGFYVKSEYAPSFFERMFDYSALPKNSRLGIESFIIGQWAGGKTDQQWQARDAYSRLDWEFYNQLPDTYRVKGMPGCKNSVMCKIGSIRTNTTDIGVGHFMLTTNSTARYGTGDISCMETNDHCG